MKDDWDWVTKVIMHKENTYAHYLSLKKLIKLFELKWSGHKNKVAYDLYVNYLKARLKLEFRRD
tara:strand:+ start:299 stop:490 length:192 start_codon:yes stop_codon:yes gene_type:complete